MQNRWPALFRDDVRPLASGCVDEIAAEMGWSVPFTWPALMRWKRSVWYCKAILKHTERVHMDGSVSGETVDDEARVMAQANLDRKPSDPRHRSAPPVPPSHLPPIIATPAAPAPHAAIAAVLPEPEPVPAPAPAKPTPAETRRAAQLKLMELAKRRKRR